MSYQLRPYQKDSVLAAVDHFRKQKSPAVIVLPTGAGKSLVIAELARIAKGSVLVLAHVKELVEQNHAKFVSYDLEAGIFSAGLSRKDHGHKITFGSIQSVARAEDHFFRDYSLLIIDECHRVSMDLDTQYHQVITKLQTVNPNLCVLGLTATPYRLGLGWIYNFHVEGSLKTTEERFFKKCVYELPLSYMVRNKYLTMPVKIDAPVSGYDFSSLKLASGSASYRASDIEEILQNQRRVTPGIIANIVDMAKDREGVMIFTSSIRHAEEIMNLLPKETSALVIGDTETERRDEIIQDFKARKLKFLVNVSVLTTGFDAPHVDLIALLRPTESVSLYQQIVGRGLRLSPGKSDCIILDYTGQNYSLFSPEIDDDKPAEESVPVQVPCPDCGYVNHFWGFLSPDGEVMEHFGRKCKGAFEDPHTLAVTPCGFRFRFKICDQCGAENDVAARVCNGCSATMVDTDKKLKDAMASKGSHVLKPDTMTLEKTYDKKGRERLEIRYYDLDGQYLTEYYYLQSQSDARGFHYNFVRLHARRPEAPPQIGSIDDVFEHMQSFRLPAFVIAHKNKYFWQIREKIFES